MEIILILCYVIEMPIIALFFSLGIMKIEDLKHVFKSSNCAPNDAKTYILSLLNKFEVALTWDNRTLLIPSLLPKEAQLRLGLPGCDVRVSYTLVLLLLRCNPIYVHK